MREEIINCIKNTVKKNYEEAEERRRIQLQKDRVEQEVKKSLLKTIDKFFSGLPEGQSYRIHLTEPNDRENPREVTKTIGAITYPVYTFIQHDFSDIGYDIIDIYIGKISIDITGFNISNEYSSHGGLKDTSHKSWNVKQLQAFVNNLDWIEEQIAKEYGCNPK